MRIVSHKLLGAVFLSLLLAGVWFTHAIFSKRFVDYERVALETSKIGLQLPARADVKLRGVIVGEALDFAATAKGATVTLGIYPEHLDSIPANVTGRIEPKTLFGEKYVSLVIPANPAPDRLEAGDTIQRTEVSIEVEKVLADLHPLLTTVQPADINKTLTAMATALEGRGGRIGENLETLDSYLKRVNPQIPALIEDLRLTARVSDVYADVMPEIARVLRNSIKTGHTLEGREAKLQQLFVDLSAFSDTGRGFLEANGDNLIRLGDVSAQQLRVFAKYAPEYPCLLQGIEKIARRHAEVFRGFMLHINLELLPNQPRSYGPQDKPVFADKRGPYCGELPNPTYDQTHIAPAPDFADGVEQPTGKGTSRVAPGFGSYAGYGGYAGSPAEAAVVKEMLAPVLGVEASEVSDLGVFLFAPMARGTAVTMR